MNFGQKYHTKIRGFHPNWKLNRSRHPPRPKLTTLVVGGRSLTLKSDTFESVGRFPPPKLDPLDLTVKPTKFGNIWRFSSKNLQKLTIFEIWWQRFTWNPPNLARSPLDLERYHRIWWDLRQIRWRSHRIWQDLNKSDEDLLDLTKI